jgi:AraC-like DNA-binding protein
VAFRDFTFGACFDKIDQERNVGSDTNLTVEDIAYALGFSDAAAFRHAFRRWTKSAPHEYRRTRFDIDVVRPLQSEAPS